MRRILKVYLLVTVTCILVSNSVHVCSLSSVRSDSLVFVSEFPFALHFLKIFELDIVFAQINESKNFAFAGNYRVHGSGKFLQRI